MTSDIAAALLEKAKACIRNHDYDQARSLLEQALTAEETAAGYRELGFVYRQTNNPDAEQAFLAALEMGPEDDLSLAALGEIYMAVGNPMAALECYARAASARPGNLSYKEKFLDLGKHIAVDRHNPALKQLIGDCLETPGLDFSAMGAAWASILIHDPGFAKLYRAPATADMAALADPYFLNGLRRTVVFSREFEAFLTALRRRLLENPDDGYVAVAAALAQYCLTTEYVFSVMPPEQARIDEAMKNGVGALNRFATAILGCYLPPYKLAESPHAAVLFGEQIAAWRGQQEIKKTIVPLTAIKDAVSSKVQVQYEEFPYPRWLGFAKEIKDEEAEGALRGTKASILVAGCGTGKEPIELAIVFPDARILAVDLSRTSLAYGMQKAAELGIGNITFRHGDILGLGDHAERYDYVTASGVLHHMDDPAKGWKILANLLKPGGLMRIALYSRIARQPVMRARRAIAEGQYPSTADGIRTFRHDIDKMLDKDDRDFLTGLSDYYYMSACRDLLFHVREHQMDLGQIGGLMKELGLDLVKLYLADNVIQQYRRRFPGDKACKNLGSWAAFEAENPAVFMEMYKFWCRKVS